MAESQNTRPIRIVLVNDEDHILQMTELVLGKFLTDALVLSLRNSRTAWHVLSRMNPDLLITDDKMPELTGEEICGRLLAKKISYPVIVNSGWPPTEQWVHECESQGMRIRFLPGPFSMEDFRKALDSSLGNRDAR